MENTVSCHHLIITVVLLWPKWYFSAQNTLLLEFLSCAAGICPAGRVGSQTTCVRRRHLMGWGGRCGCFLRFSGKVIGRDSTIFCNYVTWNVFCAASDFDDAYVGWVHSIPQIILIGFKLWSATIWQLQPEKWTLCDMRYMYHIQSLPGN